MNRSLILLAACLAVFTARALASDVAIGFIFVGPKDDYGYNQAHALGAAPVSRNCQFQEHLPTEHETKLCRS